MNILKKALFRMAAGILAGLMLFLTSCLLPDITGTWEGSLPGTPLGSASQITFYADGSGIAVGDEGSTEFTYALTDDTLTLRLGELGWGVGYRIKGDTLTIRNSDFIRVK